MTRAINPFRRPAGSFKGFLYRVFKPAGTFLAASAALLFLWFFLQSLLAFPDIAFSSPAEYYLSPDGRVILSGRASGASEIFLNGQILSVDEQGFFKETLGLPGGATLLKLTARGRFGRQRAFWRAVAVPDNSVLAGKPEIR